MASIGGRCAVIVGLPKDPAQKWIGVAPDGLAMFADARDRWYGRYGVAGELLRIVYDPNDGVPACDALALRQALVAAVVAEMLLAGQVVCADVSVSDCEGRQPQAPCAVSLTGTAVQDPAGCLVAHHVARQTRTWSIQYWMVALADQVHAAVADRFIVTRMMCWDKRADRRGRRRWVLVATPNNAGASVNALNRLQRAITAASRGTAARQPQPLSSRPPDTDPTIRARRLLEALNSPSEPEYTVADVACAALLVALGLSRHTYKESGGTGTRLHKAVPLLMMAAPDQLRLLLNHAAAVIKQTTTRVQ